MCKVAMITKLPVMTKERMTTLTKTIANCMASEKDGFGLAIALNDGSLYTEKTIETRGYSPALGRKSMDRDFATKSCAVSGKLGMTIHATGAMFHGRTSTNKGGLLNTHPIQKHGWSLIHNGVVDNIGDKYEMITQNDTEHIVEKLATGGIHTVAAELSGYYAAGAFDTKNNLHVFRDAIAPLYVAELDNGGFFFATTAEIIEKACDAMSWNRSVIEFVLDDTYLVFNTKGELIEHDDFISLGYTSRQAALAEKSLGRTLSASDDVYDPSWGGDLNFFDTMEDAAEKFVRHVRSIKVRGTFFEMEDGEAIDIEEVNALSDEEILKLTILEPTGECYDFKDFFTEFSSVG